MKEYGRLILVAVLMLICIVGLLAEPSEDLAIAEWLLTFLACKLIGLLAGLAAYKLAGKEFKNFVEAVENE